MGRRRGDSQARKAALREGQIGAFFATKERAEKFAAARQTEGYDAIVVAATAKEVSDGVRRAYEQTSQPCVVSARADDGPCATGRTGSSVGA